MNSRIKLYINTVKYLKPSQIYFRLFNKTKRIVYRRGLIKIQVPDDIVVEETAVYLIPELDFDYKYLSRFDTEDILNNKFTFINITNAADLSIAWNDKNLQHLWRYNLHYFEYLYKLAYEYYNNKNQYIYYDKFKYLVENWIDNNPFAYGDGWHPYTISLRITNWISVYSVFCDRIKADENFSERIIKSIYLQYKFLQNNLEKDVLGNHYFENIKAQIIACDFLFGGKVNNNLKKELIEQLNEQILEDGMHFELSPMYHKIILEDLIKIAYWLKDDSIYSQLLRYIQKMIDVVYSFEENFGKTPAFNDSTDGISKEYRTLVNVCSKYFGIKPKFTDSLEYSGYYIINSDTKKIIFDTGNICPSYLPAHGHCDALSFECSVDGIPTIVNSGIYRYEGGKWRDYFRSTKAHNTVIISDREQSQCWGSFRVSDRIRKVRRKRFEYQGIQFYAGAYISCFGDEHKRFIGDIDTNTFFIIDYINSETRDNVESYIHLRSEVKPRVSNNTVDAIICGKEIKITATASSKIRIGKYWYSEQFNMKEENSVLILEKDKQKDYLGCLIDFDSNDYRIIESEKSVNIVGNREISINYEELRDMI